MKKFQLILLVAGLVVFTSCGNNSEGKSSTAEANVSSTQAEASIASNKTYEVGDPVPSDLVCMVNDAYMGRLQFEVPFEGKTYYGCCDMCVERIPNDPSVRKAVDPNSGIEVDKAEAFIVLAGTQGQVDYFESEESYRAFLSR